MRITTKSRFAVAAMTDIALRDQAGPVSLSDISRRHHISVSYLEQMFSGLRQHGLVESTRGHGGGYRLARPPQKISVADIINAVSGTKASVAAKMPVPSALDTLAEDLWSSLDAKMAEHMHSIKLSVLVSEQLAKGVRPEPRTGKSRGILKKPAATPVATSAPNSVFAWARTLRTQG